MQLLRGFQFPSPLDGKRWILRLVLSQGVLCVSGGPLLIRNGRAEASVKGCGWDLALGEVRGAWLEASLKRFCPSWGLWRVAKLSPPGSIML